MDVRCDKCQARYRIDDARVGPQGLAMRCGKCGNTFRAMRETAAPVPAQPQSVPAATATPPAAPKPAAPAVARPPAAPAPAAAAAAMAAHPKPAAAVSASAARPAAAPRPTAKTPQGGGATVMFAAPPQAVAAPVATPPRAAPAPIAQPPIARPARVTPVAQKPVPPSSKAAPATSTGAAVAPLPDEAAGRTMMFNAASLKTQPPARSAAGTVKPLSKPTDAAGGTLVFGASPVGQPPKPKAKDEPSTAATILFGNPLAVVKASAPVPQPLAPPMPQPPLESGGAATAASIAEPPAADDANAPVPSSEGEAEAAVSAPEVSPEQAAADGEIAPGQHAAPAEPDAAAQSTAAHGPPRALVIGVAAAIALVLVLAGVVFAVKKLGHRAPPQAALDLLADARTAADKDSLASLAEAEAQANAAIQAAPKARFPQAYAQLAEVEVAWADALEDQAWYWGEKASRALAAGDDKQKSEAEAKASALQDAAKARVKTAFEAAAAANKIDPKSAEVAIALADYYRAAHSRLNLNRELKRATLLQADESRIAFIQGTELLAHDEGAPRALEKLKAALAAAPQSARVHFRVAMAYLAMHQDAEAKKELFETLKLSPQHERARMALELVAPPATPAPAAAAEGKKR